MIIIKRDPGPRYEALFLSSVSQPNNPFFKTESTSDGRRIEKLVERTMQKIGTVN